MAITKFDCNKIKRTFWPFVMKDEMDEEGEKVVKKGQQLAIRMPKKDVFEKMSAIQALNEEDEEAADANIIYDVLASALSNNMNRVRISAQDLEDYDIEECTQIINAYMAFVNELKNDPN